VDNNIFSIEQLNKAQLEMALSKINSQIEGLNEESKNFYLLPKPKDIKRFIGFSLNTGKENWGYFKEYPENLSKDEYHRIQRERKEKQNEINNAIKELSNKKEIIEKRISELDIISLTVNDDILPQNKKEDEYLIRHQKERNENPRKKYTDAMFDEFDLILPKYKSRDTAIEFICKKYYPNDEVKYESFSKLFNAYIEKRKTERSKKKISLLKFPK